MSAFKALCSSNLAAASALKGTPVAVFVGGTSGIGQGMAEAFARYTDGKAHIVIVGRNQQAADSILARLPKPSSSNDGWSHEFVQCDLTLMKNVQKTSSEILRRHPKINFLVLTAGIMTTDGRVETSEGIDRKLAVHYYGRWKFVEGLLPGLNKAKEDGEEAKVMSVFSAGHGAEINMDDLGLKKTYSLGNAATQAATYNDLMTEEFASRNPALTFIHAFPGGVKTNLLANSPSRLLNVAGAIANVIAAPFTVSQDTCAEYMWSSVFRNAAGAFRTGSKGEDLGQKNYYGNEEQRKKLWEHTVEATTTAET